MYVYIYTCNSRKFRSQTSDLWTDAATVVRAVREEKASEEGEKGRKVTKHCVFPMFRGSSGSKAGSLRRRARNTRDEKLHAAGACLEVEMSKRRPWLWREARVEVKAYKR